MERKAVDASYLISLIKIAEIFFNVKNKVKISLIKYFIFKNRGYKG